MSATLAHAWEGAEGAPVLVLSTSVGTNRGMWDPQAPALARRFRVLRYEHRGHDRSEAPPGPYTLDDIAGDVLALLDAAGVERFSVCGLSLGGMVGMWLAASAPERVDRLAVCCSSARFGAPEMWDERARLARTAGIEAFADTVVARWFTPAWAAAHPDVVARHRAMLAGQPAEGYASCCEAIRDMDLRPRLGAIAPPTLVIAGADDPATPVEHAQTIAAGIPGARLEVLRDAAHLANVEQADAVTALLLAHLDAGAA